MSDLKFVLYIITRNITVSDKETHRLKPLVKTTSKHMKKYTDSADLKHLYRCILFVWILKK